jgi:hypothetical protein
MDARMKQWLGILGPRKNFWVSFAHPSRPLNVGYLMRNETSTDNLLQEET